MPCSKTDHEVTTIIQLPLLYVAKIFILFAVHVIILLILSALFNSEPKRFNA